MSPKCLQSLLQKNSSRVYAAGRVLLCREQREAKLTSGRGLNLTWLARLLYEPDQCTEAARGQRRTDRQGAL